MLDDYKADLGRFGNSPAALIRELISTPGLWAVIGYRFRRRVAISRLPRPIRWLLGIPAVIVQVVGEASTCIQLPAATSIGTGLYIPHSGFIVVSSKARIGRNCTITQGVTIGHGGGGGKSLNDCPVVGDRVYLGPGSILIGSITIGDDALIGAGAVVTRSVPPRGVAVGNPARVIGRTGSFELIEYPGMDRDPARLASLAEANQEASATSTNQPSVMLNGATS